MPTDDTVKRQGPVPLFPLPNIFLIPGAIVPLHIFEPRYRRMVTDLLDKPGLLVIGTILAQDVESVAALAGPAPAVEPIAGLGSIDSYQSLADGRFLILVRGLARVRIFEKDSDREYRQVFFEPVLDAPVSAEEAGALEAELRAALATRGGASLQLPEGIGIGQLADLLILHLKLPPAAMNELFSCLGVSHRARLALARHHRGDS